MVRRSGLIAVVVLALCAWVLSASAAHAQDSTYWCSAHPALDPCVVSASLDGSALTPSDPNYDVWATPYSTGGANTVQWSIQPVPPAHDLSAALGHTFSVTIRTSVVPREEDGFGGSETITRSGPSSGNYEVTITGQPVSVTDQDGCTFPAGGPTCTPIAPGPSKVILQGEISDYNYTAYTTNPALPAGFVDSFSGMDMYTNVAETSLPPSIVEVSGQNELRIDLTDHHFLPDGTTVVHGDFYLRIPAAFLSAYWGIDDPSTLATDGLHASVGAGGGTLTVTVEPGNTGVQVQINGLTFSRRKLIVKVGHVTPHAPTHIKAKRLSSSKARVTFRAARPRGQKVTGYRLLCAVSSSDVVLVSTVKARRSPITLRRLAPRKPYRCTLQARSKAGYGARSRQFSIPR